MIEASIIVKPLESWAVDVSRKIGNPIVIIECTADRNGSVSGLAEIRLERATKKDVTAELDRHPDVECYHITQESAESLLCSITVTKWEVCSSLHQPHCYIRGAKTEKDGTLEWNILVSDDDTLQKIVTGLEESSCHVELVRKRRIANPKALAPRQEEILIMASELGYFDYPRRVTGRELARRLNISQSTFYEAIQGAQKKLVDMYLMRKSRQKFRVK